MEYPLTEPKDESEKGVDVVLIPVVMEYPLTRKLVKLLRLSMS